jgi:HPt (histidine-containing phosphotransfer) domain-containing protein
METGIIDFEILKQIIGEDKEAMNAFFELFKEQTEIEITNLKKFVEENNWEKISEIAHKLKSSYGSIGSTSAYDILAQMEFNGKNQRDYITILELNKKFLEVQNKILEMMGNF